MTCAWACCLIDTPSKSALVPHISMHMSSVQLDCLKFCDLLSIDSHDNYMCCLIWRACWVKDNFLTACDSCMFQQKRGLKLFVALTTCTAWVFSCLKPARHMCACMIACSASSIVCNELAPVATGCVLLCCDLLQLHANMHVLNWTYCKQSLSQLHQALLAVHCATSYANYVWCH